MVIVQVVANPLISMLGPTKTAHSRLTFAQAFNSLGTTIFPIVGSTLILGSLASVDPTTLSGAALDAYRTAKRQAIVSTYLGLAVALGVARVLVWLGRNRLKETGSAGDASLQAFDLLSARASAFGALCIFLYVGAEVAIGSLIVNYLMQPDVLGLARAAPASWSRSTGAARWSAGSSARRPARRQPRLVLAGVADRRDPLILISANTTGTVSGYACSPSG